MAALRNRANQFLSRVPIKDTCDDREGRNLSDLTMFRGDRNMLRGLVLFQGLGFGVHSAKAIVCPGAPPLAPWPPPSRAFPCPRMSLRTFISSSGGHRRVFLNLGSC